MRFAERLKRLVVSYWHLKLMSLGLSVVIWSFVSAVGVEEVDVHDVPIEVVTPPGMVVWSISVQSVTVRIRGTRADLARLDALYGRLNVRDVGMGKGDMRVVDAVCDRRCRFNLPHGVRLVRVSPPVIRLTLVAERSARVKVEPQLVGKVREGYEITNVEVLPSRVLVMGPEPVVKKLRAVQTVPINCDGRYESFRVEVPIEEKVERHRIKVFEKVQVKVVIAKVLDVRKFKDIEVRVLVPPGWSGPVEVKPPKVEVTLRGEKRVLDALQPTAIIPFVRLPGEGKYKLPVEVRLDAAGVEVAGSLPVVDVIAGGKGVKK